MVTSHGTLSRYSNQGCRCVDCRAANATYQRELIARYAAQGGRGEHGTPYRYDTGCRCEECRDAHNRKSREYKRRRRAAESGGPH
jgi:hypothetical protein